MEEIKETEIRIIGQKQPYKPHLDKPQLDMSQLNMSFADGSGLSEGREHISRKDCPDVRRRVSWRWIIAVLLLLIGLSSMFFLRRAESYDIIEKRQDANRMETIQESYQQANKSIQASSFTNKNISDSKTGIIKDDYCNISRIIVNDVPIKIFNAGNAVPKLTVGKVNNADPHIVMAFQAADIREDNGGIVGACIYNGEIISKGLSKVGFVAIINGNITIGAELNSPYFEEAIQGNGSFFRQYALVKDGLLIDNNHKGKSIRRAICDLNGTVIVAETETKESFHDFSQALIEYGIRNAVYLVGSSYAHGFCRGADSSLEEWGDPSVGSQKNVTYLIWENRP